MIGDAARRLGRAVLFIHQQDPVVSQAPVRARLETVFLAGRAMDFAARLREHGNALSAGRAKEYAALAGIGPHELAQLVLPALAKCDVIGFSLVDNELASIDEYVGVSASVVVQASNVLEALNPSLQERALLHSVEIASWAPLTESRHLEQLSKRGFDDETAGAALVLAEAAGINKRVSSPELRERVIYNPYVWGTGLIEIAGFLRSLPPNERDVLLGICEQAFDRPGLALPSLAGSPSVVTAARKVGLIQAATVKSSAQPLGSQTYVFSPLFAKQDDGLVTSEALHRRKLFVAHIMFGHEKAKADRGKIRDPLVLIQALLNRGQVGPATNIRTDYHLLEAAGIVEVEEVGGGRALLKLTQREIVEGGLAWLKKTMPSSAGTDVVPNLIRSPGQFLTPEGDRVALPDQGAADEVMRAAVLRLREEVRSATRLDSPL